MLVSRNLLIEQCKNIKNINNDEFIYACNKVGIEVEQIYIHPKTKGLKVVKIIEINKHPHADKLNLVKIDLGNKNIKEIICGANNLKVNYYAIYAPVGTQLYNGMILEIKKIRDIYSEGMLCAYSELTNIGIDNLSISDQEGIVLFKNKISNNDIIHELGLDDVIYDLSIPSNRNDLNSILCLLKELSIHLNINFSLISKFNFPKKNNIIAFDLNKEIATNFSLVSINDSYDFKFNYQKKSMLIASGIKIHDNLIDLLNYIFLLSGNPIHCYNSEKINNYIKIDFLKKDEKLTTLQNEVIKIKKGNFAAFDKKNNIVSLPFIIGMNETKFTNGSKALIEIGNFDYLLVRKEINELKFNSRSSQIGNKPISPFNTQLAFYLLIEYLNKHKIKYDCNYHFSSLKNKELLIDYNKMENFIGCDFNHQEIRQLLNQTIFKTNGNKISIHPSRLDIENVYDIYEEVMKIIDINKLDLKPINFDILSFKTNHQDSIKRINNFLIDHGFLEVKTYNLASKTNSNKFDYLKLYSNISIINPISNQREFLKSNAIDDMIKIIQYNSSRKHQLYNIFEISKIQVSLDKTVNLLNMVIVKDFYYSNIDHLAIKKSLINLKSFIKALVNTSNIDFKVIDYEKIEILCKNKVIGYIFTINERELNQDYNIKDLKNIIAATLIIDDKLFNLNQFELKEISIYPYVERDINITIKPNENINDYLMKISKVDYIHDSYIKDVFEKDNKKIYTISLTISDMHKNLSTEDINLIINNVNQIIKN